MTQDTIHQRMTNALLFLQNSLDQSLDPNDVAAKACFSLPHFHRMFKAMVGETLGAHIRRLRLERAALQLAYGDSQVTEIAFDAGYETLESFSRAFRKMFGGPPTQFRAERKKPTMPNVVSGIHYAPGTALPELRVPMPNIEASIVERPAIHVACVRHTGAYEECTGAWETLCEWAGKNGLFSMGAEFIGLSYDDPSITEAKNIRYEACIPVPEKMEPEGTIFMQTIPAATYVHYLHKGPYRLLESTYTQLVGSWILHHGYELEMLPSLEVYLNDSRTTPENDLLTEIYIPIVTS